MKFIKIIFSLLYCLFLLNLTTSAQLSSEDFNIKWSEKMQVDKKWVRIEKIAGTDEVNIYASRTKYRGYDRKPLSAPKSKKDLVYLEKIDKKSLKIKTSVKIDMTYKGRPLEYFDFLEINGKLFLITTKYNARNKNAILLAQHVSKKTLLPSKEHIILAEIKTNLWKQGTFVLVTSEDQTKIAIFPKNISGSDSFFNKKNKFYIAVFNSNFKNLWKKETTIGQENEYIFDNYVVGNDGTACFVSIKTNLSKHKEHKYRVHSFLDDEHNEFKLDIEEVRMYSIKLLIKDHHLFCAGLYSSKGEIITGGSFFVDINIHSNELINKIATDFDEETPVSDLSKEEKRKLKKKKKKLEEKALHSRYSADYLLPNKNGGFYFITEQIEVRTIHVQSIIHPNKKNPRLKYFFNEILIIEFSSDGKIRMVNKIQKKQGSTIKKHSSYTLLYYDYKPYFIINSAIFYGRGEKLKLINFDDKGSMQVVDLCEIGSMKMLTCPNISTQTGLAEVIIYSEADKRYKFCSLTVK